MGDESADTIGARQQESSSPLAVGMAVLIPSQEQKRTAVMVASSKVRLEAFCRALSSSVNLQAVPRFFDSYEELLSSVRREEVHLAWLPPLVASRALNESVAEALVMPVRDEAAWYASALFTRPDSEVRSLEDLHGLTAAWVDPQSMAGYMAIRIWLERYGIHPSKAFVRDSFLGSHERVVKAVLKGEADVGATFVHFGPDGASVRDAGWGNREVRVLAVSNSIPPDILAVHPSVQQRIRDRVTEVLTSGEEDELRAAALALFEADRFVPVSASRLAPLLELMNAVGDDELS